MKLLILYGVLWNGLKEINAEFTGTFASGRTLGNVNDGFDCFECRFLTVDISGYCGNKFIGDL